MTRLAAITGATGFLGRHVLETLTKSGWQLRLLVRQDPRLRLAGEAVELIPGSLADQSAVEQLVDGVDAVIHLAGLIKALNKSEFASVNIEGTKTLVNAWQAKAPMARFVMVSTLAAREPHLSDYAWSKAEAEKCLQDKPGQWVILRPCAVYGPGDKETLSIFKAAHLPFQPLFNGDDARVALVHVKDVARAVGVSVAQKLPNQIYEVSDSAFSGYSWREIAEAACHAVGRPCRTLPVPSAITRGLGVLGDTVGLIARKPQMITSSKIGEVLHTDWSSASGAQLPPDYWQSEIGLEQGFRETVDWYRTNNWLK